MEDRIKAMTYVFEQLYGTKHEEEFPVEEVDFRVTFMSLVGISGTDYPLGFGNYCGLGKYYCCNILFKVNLI